MIRINLLPVRQIRKRQRLVNEIIFLLVTVVLVLMGISSVGLVLAHQIDNLKQEIQQLQIKKASYTPILKQIEELKNYKKNLETKMDTIKTLKKGSQLTVRLLDEIANRTPNSRLWLKTLRQDAGGTILMTGVALDNATIAQYMDTLTASPYFSSAELASSSQTAIAGQKLKSFSLTLGIQPEPEGQQNQGSTPGSK